MLETGREPYVDSAGEGSRRRISAWARPDDGKGRDVVLVRRLRAERFHVTSASGAIEFKEESATLSRIMAGKRSAVFRVAYTPGRPMMIVEKITE